MFDPANNKVVDSNIIAIPQIIHGKISRHKFIP
jgi:hypothetical protein